jgi:hypothetical protein
VGKLFKDRNYMRKYSTLLYDSLMECSQILEI